MVLPDTFIDHEAPAQHVRAGGPHGTEYRQHGARRARPRRGREPRLNRLTGGCHEASDASVDHGGARSPCGLGFCPCERIVPRDQGRDARFLRRKHVQPWAWRAIPGLRDNGNSVAEGRPERPSALKFDKDALVHHWFADGDLKLHLYSERKGDTPHGYVELVVETKQSPDDETAYDGTYELQIDDTTDVKDGEGRKLEAEGKAACSVG